MEPAKIFLADERGKNETPHMRSFLTFNFGTYYNQHKTAFGKLYAFNDDTLAPGHRISTHIDQSGYLLLLPIVGCIAYADNAGDKTMLQAGQLLITAVKPGRIVEIQNPMDELVNYLQIRIKSDGAADNDLWLLDFDLDAAQNSIASFTLDSTIIDTNRLPVSVAIGKFDGRKELIYTPLRKDHGVFLFAIDGAFEVQKRLLHPRDGLGLWAPDAVEAEALSNEAILFLLEVPL